jgi:hypothetical protein
MVGEANFMALGFGSVVVDVFGTPQVAIMCREPLVQNRFRTHPRHMWIIKG